MELYKVVKFGTDHAQLYDGLKSSSNFCSKYNNSDNKIVRMSDTVEHCMLRLFDEVNGTNYSDDLSWHPDFAIGKTADGMTVVERLSAKKNERTILVFNPEKNSFRGCVIDINKQKVAFNKTPGSDLYLYAMLPTLLEDSELDNEFNKFNDSLNAGEVESSWNILFVIGDNIYRRLRYWDYSSLNTDNMEVISGVELDSGALVVQEVLYGTFVTTKTMEGSAEKRVEVDISKDNFVGQYRIDENRVFTEEEQRLIDGNVLDEYYILSNVDVEICQDIKHTTEESVPFRTFTLVGPPGTGKSSMVKAVSNGIMQPSVIYNCHPNTEIFDFVGQVMPPDVDSTDRVAHEFAAKIEELGGMNFKNIASVLKLPTANDVLLAPDAVYKDITGKTKTEDGRVPNASDTLKKYTEFMTQQFNESLRKLAVAAKSGSSFRYTETDFIKAVKNGWVVEIQEPTVILNEGVLVGLNSLLAEGVITLPTGKTIQRHRDNVVFFTTNVSLAGCRNMNQSLIDRSNEIFNVEMPSLESMVRRAISISGETDSEKVLEMAKIILEIQDDMLKSGIDDGVCGMRSLVNWVIKSKYMDPYKAGISTVVNKATLDDDARDSIKKHLTESKFYRDYRI